MAIFIFSLIIVCIIIMMCVCNKKPKHVAGFWEADSEFCKNAELDMFCMFISDDLTKGYVFAKRDQGIFLNEPTNIKISKNIANLSNVYDISFSLVHEFFPSNHKMRINDNKMTLVSNGTTYAVLYKNAVLTDQIKNKTENIEKLIV